MYFFIPQNFPHLSLDCSGICRNAQVSDAGPRSPMEVERLGATSRAVQQTKPSAAPQNQGVNAAPPTNIIRPRLKR